ncbi:type 1 glutamine amidotransferase domain-containing protein [Kangiella sp. HZ709]|uniref:type 1 glutamine amidotransferase domain-containing protein n=1 Tax=Kangiella sp. HZ709 TaxID=2666328 RepID=UPI0012B04C64|nr:type 1 glutamine amidotransferase domain-containing protein [Kangiella sp. HZ709]MRX27864.1 type 1 glutamine amidotransferase domain-containing protein [Kangiella sp. HZ709]
MKVLMVLTSHDKLGNTGNKTGFWLEEFATPYYVFKDAGAALILASPQGGHPPLDPKSNDADSQTDATIRFGSDDNAQHQLATTHKLSEIDINDFDGIFYPGGHGPLWDLAEDKNSIALIEAAYEAEKVISAVCHAPAVFKNTKSASGEPLIKGKTVTGFSNTEEEAVQLTNIVPFLVEDMITENGAHYSKDEDWHPHCVVDGLLITGQNPASSEAVAQAVLKKLSSINIQ